VLRAIIIVTWLAAASPAAADRPTIAIGGSGSIGGASDHGLLELVAKALAARTDVSLIGPRRVKAALRRARKPQLESCEGDTGCLAEMGRAVGARWVVAVEVSGLGDVQLLHLKLVDSRRARVIRSTTSEVIGGAIEPGALVRLLTPRRYRGELALAINAAGAQVFVDGRRLATAPLSAPLELPVGPHALRITHPEYRDYVRFVDIAYGERVDLGVDMAPLSVVQSEVTATGGRPGGDRDRPWYGRWYVVAGVGAAVLAGSIAVWALTADGLDFDRERDR
jgi:hypothetical protein